MSLNAVFSISGDTLRFTLTDLVDPTDQVRRIEIPRHDLVTVRGTDAASSITRSVLSPNRNATGDTFQNVATTAAGGVQNSYLAIANESGLAAGFATNAVPDNTLPTVGDRYTVHSNNRMKSQITGDGAAKQGSVWDGTWTWLGNAAYTYKGIGRDADPWIEVGITSDANNDATVDWQDATIATREITEPANGSENVPHRVVHRIPFNITSQATHPFLRTPNSWAEVPSRQRRRSSAEGLEAWKARGSS